VRAARADDMGPYSPGSSTQLALSHYTETFTYPEGPRGFEADEYGVSYYEPLTDLVALGLQGGYLTSDVDGDAVASLVSYSGEYLGFMGRYQLPLGADWGDHFSFYAELRYLWHDQQGQFSGQQSDITWYESYGRAGPMLRYGPWRLEAGGYYQHSSGYEVDTGTVNQRRDINARGGGAYAGLVFYVEPDGWVGLYGYAGSRREMRLVFSREFD
ncbi:MAG TPA: hypothetical protein VGS99_06190, partial [Gammaproteobacteria bacterium]|nr:hypothetical protein [Gammaproteobacteria bacterium]